MMMRIKLEITRKPPPPPLDPFECVVCQEMIERDPHTPEHQEPPVCFRCAISVRTQLGGAPHEMWKPLHRAAAILAAMKKEIACARRAH